MKYIIPIPEPLGLCAFLHLFNNDHEALTCFIYGEFVDDKVFTAIGFENYEAIGDLQGSNLLQSELAVELAIETLFRNSRHDNLAYLELRSNISNICRNILTPTQAFGLLCRQLEKQCRSTGIDARLIITASRHRDTDQISTLINTVCTIMQNPELTPWLAGLDLAGDEQAMKPEEVRKAFLPALHQCLHVTIHAGENQPVENIWAAAYHLSAERIGHGLTLRENHSLLSNFRDRGIDLEMCPTSNHQIVGYPQFPLSDNDPGNYPLQHYLQQGLNVTVNTDNPGISQTNASKELYRAASMSFNGLSLLDIAQIIKNGFSAAFLPHSTRKQLLLSTEQNLVREYYRISSRQANL
nr:hypothetical protein [Desulfurispira natronophila]